MILKLLWCPKFFHFTTGLGNYTLLTQHKAAARAPDELHLIKCYQPHEIVDRIQERIERNASLSNESGTLGKPHHLYLQLSYSIVIHNLHSLIIDVTFIIRIVYIDNEEDVSITASPEIQDQGNVIAMCITNSRIHYSKGYICTVHILGGDLKNNNLHHSWKKSLCSQ